MLSVRPLQRVVSLYHPAYPTIIHAHTALAGPSIHTYIHIHTHNHHLAVATRLTRRERDLLDLIPEEIFLHYRPRVLLRHNVERVDRAVVLLTHEKCPCVRRHARGVVHVAVHVAVLDLQGVDVDRVHDAAPGFALAADERHVELLEVIQADGRVDLWGGCKGGRRVRKRSEDERQGDEETERVEGRG